jgi:hypothetical protein
LSRHLPRALGRDAIIIIIITKRKRMLNILGKDDIFPRVIDEVDEKENGDADDDDADDDADDDGNMSPTKNLLEEQHNKGCRGDDNVVDFSLFRRLSIFDDDRKENDDQSMTGETEGRNLA